MFPFFIVVIVAILLRAFVFQSYIVVSGSMLPTLDVGQRVATQLVVTTPSPGDVVVFTPVDASPAVGGLVAIFNVVRSPFGNTGQVPVVLIKRVVATGGQSVSAVDGVVYVDGLPFLGAVTVGTTYDFGPVVVLSGYFFVLGDNRTSSEDSRSFGIVPVEHVVAVMMFEF